MSGYYKENESGKLVFIPSGDMPNQQVGIYWFIDNEVIKDAVPYKEGEPYGEAIQHGSHYEFWQTIKPATEIEKKLKSRAYDAYPRGRIVFFPSREVFCIYMDRCLENVSKLIKVLKSFEIENVHFEIEIDEHYRCAVCNPYFIDL
jgi:hypothetical protein